MKKLHLFILVVCCGFLGHAQVNRTIPPEADTPKTLNVGKLIPMVLDNGLRVYLAPVKDYPKFTMSVNIESPSLDEETRLAEKRVLGSAYSNKLSKKYPNHEIDSMENTYPAMINVNTYGGTVKGMKKDIDDLLDAYRDLMLHPIITKEIISEKHKEFLARKKKAKKPLSQPSPKFSLDAIVDSLLFGAKKEEEKTKTRLAPNFKGLTVQDVYDYKNDRILSNNALVVIVGDFTESECRALMTRYFGAWKAGTKYVKKNVVKKKTAIIKNRKIVVKDVPDAVQSKISFKWHLGDAFTYFEDDIKLQVLNKIFGESQLSYLYKNLREDKGLCYYIRSSVGSSAAGGTGSVATDVRNEQTAYAIENIVLEMLRLRNEDVSASDLKIAKNSLIGEHTRSLSPIAPISYITFAMQKDVYGLPDDYLQNKVKQYYDVTIEDVKTMAQKYIDPFKCVITISGKVSELKGTLEKFGEVLYYDQNGNRI
ncbi:insulinase family protein [Maribacter sp. MMG018]|uniref:M16 family metallopeptidase n=1 Tax=Maribacter sp. MMG018 TaxID=2822688 RepID=UPI001B387E4D|nr:insulinase family protein [Maribacter sp. MMG018]MBQ4915103.1 insulinase family protein [Maribacter sp. MMG018]